MFRAGNFFPLKNYFFELTTLSLALRSPNFPKRTWKGEDTKVPSSCSTTITSIAPVRVAPLRSLYQSLTPEKNVRKLMVVAF